MSVRFEVVITRSGAPAMRDRETGEIMHPLVGPIVEAEKLYVAPSRLAERLREPAESPLVLLDVGLGAGTNAIAAWWVARRADPGARRLVIESFDVTTEAMETALRAEHREAFAFGGDAAAAASALLADGATEDDRVTWRLHRGELPGSLTGVAEDAADVVFWDPFSPRQNPGLWSMGAFVVLRSRCRARATVHTYAAATSVRTAFLLGGFAVGVGDADREGRESTAAAVDVADLRRPLDAAFLERLRRSSAPFPADAPADALDRMAALPQLGRRAPS